MHLTIVFIYLKTDNSIYPPANTGSTQKVMRHEIKAIAVPFINLIILYSQFLGIVGCIKKSKNI